jgi:hypothetical protein
MKAKIIYMFSFPSGHFEGCAITGAMTEAPQEGA